mmetsp:Transcript_88314/g.175561  ORF Transcript_88314/g.175561 Transcript_88314/m.175561 type:complete len:247 (+) Transcript_88314:673-1413(+)
MGLLQTSRMSQRPLRLLWRRHLCRQQVDPTIARRTGIIGRRSGRTTSRHGAARQRESAALKIPRDARLIALLATARGLAAARSNMQLSIAFLARTMHVLWPMASCSRIVRGAPSADLQMRVARLPKCHQFLPGRQQKRRQRLALHVPNTIAKTATTIGKTDGTMGNRLGAVSMSAARARRRPAKHRRRRQLQGILTAQLALPTGRTSGTRVSRLGAAFTKSVLVQFPARPHQQQQLEVQTQQQPRC